MIRNLKPFQSLTHPWRCDSGQSGTRPLDFWAILCHIRTMNKTSNPYAQQVLAQGRDLSNAPAKKRQFPCTIGLRTFQTEDEYKEALHEFMNGM